MDENEIKKITEYIFVSDPLKKADIGFVFGTKYDEPVREAVRLYNDGMIKYLMFSGGINKKTKENEARRMFNLAIESGIPEESLIIEDKSTNTLENVLFSKIILEKKFGLANIKNILIIVKHFHSRRALMTFKKHLPKTINCIAYPYKQNGFTKDNWHLSEIGKTKVLGEYKKIPSYLAQGDIEELDK